MKNSIKLKIGLIALMVILVTIFIVSIVDAKELADITELTPKGKDAIEDTLSLGYNSIANKMNTYCLQHSKKLRTAKQSYTVHKYAEIDGKTATIYAKTVQNGKVVKSKYNAIVAYIFNQKQGYGTVEHKTDAQWALWYYVNDWTETLFDRNEYDCDGNEGINISNNKVAQKAQEYAANIGKTTSESDGEKLEMTDQTPNKDKLKKVDLGNGYYRIGPFKWEFEGNLKNIAVKADGNKVTDVKFVKAEGRSLKDVNVKDIESGDKFYIEIKDAKDVTSVHLDLRVYKKITVETVKVWFLKSAETYQNLVHVAPSEKPVEAENVAHQDYTVKKVEEKKGELTIQKIDDRGEKTPLENVGFVISAQIRVWKHKETVDDTKACTHWNPGYWEHPHGDGKDENGNNISCIHWNPGYHSHASDPWRRNVYKQEVVTMYLGSDCKWGNTPHTFYTDEQGTIAISGITLPDPLIATNINYDGEKDIKLEAEYVDNNITATEVENKYYGYKDEINTSFTISRTSSKTQELKNHQKLVKLSGYVWLEDNEGKTTIRNDLYDRNDEQGVNGVKVYLKDTSGNIIKQTTTSPMGIYSEINGGEYRFKDVNLDELQAGKYHIEFEYGGMRYQSVTPKLSRENGSKAIDTNSRNILDSKFTSVDGNGTQSLHIGGVNANYNTMNGHVSTVNNYEYDNVYARTDEAGYDLYSDFEPTMEEIRYINLGLFEKEQTDYALTKDLYNVRVEVNGKSHIYRYGTTRYDSEGEVDLESSWNVGVKFQRNIGTYSRAIYTADAEYETANKDKELKVYLTYKIALRNESPYLGRINNIYDYCDNRMILTHVGTAINEQDVISNEIGREQVSYNNGNYSKYRIDTNAVINSGETQFIYVQFEMNRYAVLTLINNGEVLNNVVEINSYTTFKDNNVNTPVAVVDKDSVPGTAVPGDSDNTYEDDTDAARSLKLELKDARAITGTVFVDSTGKEGKEAVEGEERRGNGIFDNGETTLGGIKVTLKENSGSGKVYETVTVDNNGTYGYILEQSENKLYFKPEIYNDAHKSQYAYVAENLTKGDFYISNYIPGDYTLTYTWGDSTYKVQYYKGTIYNSNRKQNNPYWYRGSEYNDDIISVNDRYTDALDNKDTRTKIEQEMNNIKINTLEAKIKQAYADKEAGKEAGKEAKMTTEMDSITPKMEISVEYPTTITDGTVEQVKFAIRNVDFGIVERAKQALDLTKRIAGYKITLANGQVLVDATIDEKGKISGSHDHTTYMGPTNSNEIKSFGILRTEMDNELIEGATLETTYIMKVKNIGELDYSTEDYYYYGIKDDNNKVTASVTELVDYVDGRLNNNNPDGIWQETNKDYLNKVNASKKDAEDINEYRTYLTKKLAKALAPGDASEVNLYTSKLLTSTDDNTFNNESEITEVTKNPKGFIGTPVKVTWNGEKYHFDIGDSEEIVIIPSTGEDKDYVLPIVIGISTLIILGAGVVLIKKFVIDKK